MYKECYHYFEEKQHVLEENNKINCILLTRLIDELSKREDHELEKYRF